MSFEIGKKVQSSGITQEQLQNSQELKNKDKELVSSLFDQFNTNKTTETINGKEEQVLDQTEQAALMTFFKKLAGKDNKDTKVTRRDVKAFKKSEQGQQTAVQNNMSYGSIKRIMKAFTGAVGDSGTDVTDWGTDDADGNRTIKIGGKEYKVDKENHVRDAEGKTYEYDEKTGLLKEIKEGSTSTTFAKGVKNQQVVKNGNETTTSIYGSDGKTKIRDVKVDNNDTNNPITTTTNYLPSGGITDRTIDSKKDGTIKFNYSTHEKTTTKDNVRMTESFKESDPKTGEVKGDLTTKSVEILDENGQKVTKTITFEKGKAKVKIGDKSVELDMDKDGNIIANGMFRGTRMETVGEAAIRLGFNQGSPAYNKIIELNGGADTKIEPGKGITIPKDSYANFAKAITDPANADVKADEQKTAETTYHTRIKTANTILRSGKYSRVRNKDAQKYSDCKDVDAVMKKAGITNADAQTKADFIAANPSIFDEKGNVIKHPDWMKLDVIKKAVPKKVAAAKKPAAPKKDVKPKKVKTETPKNDAPKTDPFFEKAYTLNMSYGERYSNFYKGTVTFYNKSKEKITYSTKRFYNPTTEKHLMVQDLKQQIEDAGFKNITINA